MKIRCIAVDDEPLALKIIEDYVNQIDYLEYLIGFDKPLEAISYLKDHDVDLLFLAWRFPLGNIRQAKGSRQHQASLSSPGLPGSGVLDLNSKVKNRFLQGRSHVPDSPGLGSLGALRWAGAYTVGEASGGFPYSAGWTRRSVWGEEQMQDKGEHRP